MTPAGKLLLMAGIGAVFACGLTVGMLATMMECVCGADRE